MSNITLNIKTVPAGDALLGRVIDAAGQPIDGGGPLADVRRIPIERPATSETTPADQVLETGIKVIDLYAPIARGGTIGMVGGSGVGKIVVTTELIQRVAARKSGCGVLALVDDSSYGRAEIVGDLRGGGVERHVATLFCRPDDSPQLKRQAALAGLALAEDFCERGRETLLFLDEKLVTEETIDRLLRRAHGGEGAALTVLVWQYETPASVGDDHILGRLFRNRDGQVVFSRVMAKQNIWPAIDPVASGSRLLDERVVGVEHVRVAKAARDLLLRGGVLDDNAAERDEALQGRARRVLLFGSQPFVVAEPFTALPGEHVAVEETVRGFGEIVAGRHDDLPEEALRFVGTIDQALAK